MTSQCYSTIYAGRVSK